MSIKPDHWIEKMALEHAMIEPFEAGQVRDGVISLDGSSHAVGRSPGVVSQAHDEPQARVGEQISNLIVGRQAPGHAVGRPSAR